MLELAHTLDTKKDITSIKNLYVKKDGTIHKNSLRPLVDINELAYPDREIYLQYKEFREQKIYNFGVSRGCFYRCNFCFIHQWKELYKSVQNKQTVRLRSIDKSIKEIKMLANNVNISIVSFVDSTFNLDKKWTLAFLNEYRLQIAIPFTINLRADLIDEEIVKTIAETKCCQTIRMGIEVGNEKMRREVLSKNISNKQIYHAISLLKKYKVKVVIFIMYGLPGETLQDALETVEMAQKIKPYSISPQIFHPYPGLNITKYAIAKGYLKHTDLLKTGNKQYKVFRSILRQPEIDEVTNLLKLSVIAIRFPHLLPIIKKLVRVRPNRMFDVIYMISAFFMLRKYTVVSIKAL